MSVDQTESSRVLAEEEERVVAVWLIFCDKVRLSWSITSVEIVGITVEDLKREQHPIGKEMVEAVVSLEKQLDALSELTSESEYILEGCQLQSRGDDELVSTGALMCLKPTKAPRQYGSGKRLKEINEKITNIRKPIASHPCHHLGITSTLQALSSSTKTAEVSKIACSTSKTFCVPHYLWTRDLSNSIFGTSLSSILNQTGFGQQIINLSLSNTHPLVQLPPSLEKLSNLQVLDVSFCQNLKTLPSYIVTFKKLRILNVSHCLALECMPEGLGRLSNLEVLLGFRPAGPHQMQACQIAELRNLAKLKKLRIEMIRDDEISNDDETVLINLQEVQHVSKIYLD